MSKKKIWFFRYDTWQDKLVYLPHTWYEFKRYYELNGKFADDWEWIPPIKDYHDWTIDDIVEEAVSHRADVYMFSSYMWSWDTIKVVANGIREELPDAILTIGGPHQHTTYTAPMIWFKDHPYFNAASNPHVFGEFFITDMLDAISANDLDWSKIRGSYTKYGRGPDGDRREFVYPPDIFRSNIDHAREVAKLAADKNKLMGVMYETNRGCMYKCVYCEWGGGTNTKVVMKSMESIKDDISFFRELNIHTTWITDANFGMMHRDPEIAELFASQNDYMKFVGITGLAKTKSEKRASVLEPLIKAGLVPLYQISLQTIDEQILKNILRTDVTPEENISLAKYLIEKYDIDVIVELILGLPGMKVETFYKETAIEYTLMNKVKPHTHHVPLYVLPDAPVGDPAYLSKYEIKLAPIAIEESVGLLKNTGSKYINLYNSKNYKRENTLHIPIASYSYTVEDWKEMFFMNDMNHVLMNMIIITPLIDFLYYHKNVPLERIFKGIFNSLKSVDEFWHPVYNDYLSAIADGKYWNDSWRRFEVGPIKGLWTIHSSYAWLWCEHKDKIYEKIRLEFSDHVDEIVDDCLTYCKNSTFNAKEDIIWSNNFRWDIWEEEGVRENQVKKEKITLITKSLEPDWGDKNSLYRNSFTYRLDSNEKIKMRLFQNLGAKG